MIVSYFVCMHICIYSVLHTVIRIRFTHFFFKAFDNQPNTII